MEILEKSVTLMYADCMSLHANENGKKLIIDGFVYVKSRERGTRMYWDRQKVRPGECTAQAVTSLIKRPLDSITVLSGPTTSRLSHPPNQDAVKAQVIVEEMKTLAEAQSELPPSAIFRDALATAPTHVIAEVLRMFQELHDDSPDEVDECSSTLIGFTYVVSQRKAKDVQSDHDMNPAHRTSMTQ